MDKNTSIDACDAPLLELQIQISTMWYERKKLRVENEVLKGQKKIGMDDLIDQFVGDLEFDVLIAWADILGVEHDENMWLDDMWTDAETKLRQEVAEAMGKIGQKGETKNAMR